MAEKQKMKKEMGKMACFGISFAFFTAEHNSL